MHTNKNKTTVTPIAKLPHATEKVTAIPQVKASDLGLVSLVAAGPGDPELLTMKAFRVIQQTNVIIYDHLVSKEICALFPENIEVFYVGIREGTNNITQQQIERLMITKAKQGLNICRLKGGDLLGRGDEELATLKQLSIKVQVIPGVISAAASAAYLPFDFAMAL